VSYIDDLIEHGTNFKVRRGEGTVSFTPVSGRDEDIDAFQGVVRELRRNEGDGYSMREHEMTDRGISLVDLMLVTVEHRG